MSLPGLGIKNARAFETFLHLFPYGAAGGSNTDAVWQISIFVSVPIVYLLFAAI